jgi:hypothetical protein
VALDPRWRGNDVFKKNFVSSRLRSHPFLFEGGVDFPYKPRLIAQGGA